MHIQKDYYICDCCKSETPSNEIKPVIIPIECGYKIRNAESFRIELCNDCYRELQNVIRKHFHHWSYSRFDDLVDEEENEDE